MENNKRFWIFMVASMAIWLGWLWFNPPQAQKPLDKKPAADEKVAKDDPQQAPPADEKPRCGTGGRQRRKLR